MRNLIPHVIQDYYQHNTFAGDFQALTLFVDVSGFTAMTQALMSHGHEGAEMRGFAKDANAELNPRSLEKYIVAIQQEKRKISRMILNHNEKSNEEHI